MGALTSTRNRADECSTPSSLYNNSHCSSTNCIDTRVSKKPRIDYFPSSSLSSLSLSCVGGTKQGGAVSRLHRFPEVKGKLKREVHAPCRSRGVGFGFKSSLSVARGVGFKGETSGKRVVRLMGNALGGLWRNYDKAKRGALGVLRHVKVGEEEEEEVVGSEESSEVVIVEDGNEVGSGVGSDGRRGLGLVLDRRELGGEAGENGVGLSSPAVGMDGVVVHGVSREYDLEAYKRLLTSVDRTYNPTLSRLEFDIKSYEAKRSSLQSLKSLKKRQEDKKPEEDLLSELFVPLTEEEKSQVNRALSNSNRRRLLVTHENSNIQITGEVLQCLRPGAWLNDEVINVFMELLKERERREPKKFLSCHFFNTFFYKKLIGGRNGYDYKAVRRWTTQKKLGYKLADCEKIFVPIHKEVHWCLAVINKKDKTFQYLDSLGGRDLQVLRVLAKYYVDEVKDKCGQDIDVDSWKSEFVDDLPEQRNGFDCGVFMIKYADFYSRGMGLHFSQENMPYFRLRTAKEILKLRAD